MERFIGVIIMAVFVGAMFGLFSDRYWVRVVARIILVVLVMAYGVGVMIATGQPVIVAVVAATGYVFLKILFRPRD